MTSNLSNVEALRVQLENLIGCRQVVFSTLKAANSNVNGVKVAGVIHDPSPMKMVYEPKHPLANEEGYVAMPNVNVVDEMVNMMSASRSYQNSVDMMNTTKSRLQKTLTIGQ